jgi:hypothetical protein
MGVPIMSSVSTTGFSMPRTDAELSVWFHNFAAIIAEDPAAARVAVDEAAELAALADAYNKALNLALAPDTRTANTIALKDAARDKADRAFRRVRNRIRTDDRVTDALKLELGIRPAEKAARRRLPAPTTAPLLTLVSAVHGAHILRYADSATPDCSRKPHGVQQLQLFMAVGDREAASPDEASYLAAFTRSPFEVECDDAHDGLMATYFGRWCTRTALVGPWSAPVSMTIIGSGQG